MKFDKDIPAIGVQQDDGVLVFTLTKPEKLNAWDTPMRARLGELLQQADADPQVRAIVLTGAGERAFCAGADLTEQYRFASEYATPEERARQSMAHWRIFYGQILRVGKPLVAALNGVAAGSAFQVAMMADFRVAHAGVTLGQPEVLSGIPSISGTTLMMRRLGAAVAAEFALSGRLMDAEEAKHLGLISRIVPAGDVLKESIALAREMGERSPVAFRQTKNWLHQPELRDLDAAFDFAEKANVIALRDGDMVQRIEAFTKKHTKQGTTI